MTGKVSVIRTPKRSGPYTIGPAIEAGRRVSNDFGHGKSNQTTRLAVKILSFHRLRHRKAGIPPIGQARSRGTWSCEPDKDQQCKSQVTQSIISMKCRTGYPLACLSRRIAAYLLD